MHRTQDTATHKSNKPHMHKSKHTEADGSVCVGAGSVGVCVFNIINTEVHVFGHEHKRRNKTHTRKATHENKHTGVHVCACACVCVCSYLRL